MTRLPLHWQILIGMVLGAAIGITCNWTLGERSAEAPGDQLPDPWRRLTFHDTTDRITIWCEHADGTTSRWLVDPTGWGTEHPEGTEVFSSLDALARQEPQVARLFEMHGVSTARRVGETARRLGNLFLRLLRMVAVPLIVTSLVTGVLGLGDTNRLGWMFGRTLVYYVSTSLLAIVTGLLLVNLIRPGLKSDVPFPRGEAVESGGSLGGILFSQLESMIPANPFQALAEGHFLSVICFSLAFAVFTLLVGGAVAERLRALFQDAFTVMMAMTMAIIRLAPLGVLLMMLYATATQGPGVFEALAWYMVTVLLALATHACVTLPLILLLVAKRPPVPFARAMMPALLTAFSSASSNGTLPLTLACVERRAGIDNRVGSFVLPLGATVNMDGTALYEAVAVLFIAQVHFGVSLPLTSQIIVAVTALLASIGAAGIPHAGLVMMVIILQAVNLPVEMQGIILAVDRVLDMCRTAVNVWSDSCGCAVVARLEPSLEESV
jgi:proton glutamate symport protein